MFGRLMHVCGMYRADVWGSMSPVLPGHSRSCYVEMDLEARGLAQLVEKWITGQETREIRVFFKKIMAEILFLYYC